MGKEFHYSINMLSLEEASLWNSNHTLKEIRDNKHSLMMKTLAGLTTEEMPRWLIVDQIGILGISLHDVYISFSLTWLFTHKGRRRRVNRALRMMGVPFIKVKRTSNGAEVATDGFEVVDITRLKEK